MAEGLARVIPIGGLCVPVCEHPSPLGPPGRAFCSLREGEGWTGRPRQAYDLKKRSSLPGLGRRLAESHDLMEAAKRSNRSLDHEGFELHTIRPSLAGRATCPPINHARADVKLSPGSSP